VQFRENDRSQSLPVVNYTSAIEKAVEWLGDRYLLAKPMNTTIRREQSPRVQWRMRLGLHADVNHLEML
jgi:hypothetical protein